MGRRNAPWRMHDGNWCREWCSVQGCIGRWACGRFLGKGCQTLAPPHPPPGQAKAEKLVREAAAAGANIILLQVRLARVPACRPVRDRH